MCSTDNDNALGAATRQVNKLGEETRTPDRHVCHVSDYTITRSELPSLLLCTVLTHAVIAYCFILTLHLHCLLDCVLHNN